MNLIDNILIKLRLKSKPVVETEDKPLNEIVDNINADLVPIEELDRMTERLMDVSNKPLKLVEPKKKPVAKKAAKKSVKKTTRSPKKTDPKNPNDIS
jgi:hypothetical protein